MLAADAPYQQSLAEDADGRCLVIVNKMARDGLIVADVALPANAYFVGKLHGRNPAIDLPKIVNRMKKSSDTERPDEVRRCGAEMARIGREMDSAADAFDLP